MKQLLTTLVVFLVVVSGFAADIITQQDMERIYQEVRTPYKYGMVVAPTDNYHKIDCPTVFRKGDRWLMTYVQGRWLGHEPAWRLSCPYRLDMGW